MGSREKQNQTPAVADEARAADRRQAVGRDRRTDQAVDLTDEDIAGIEASEMASGFEQLDAELDPKPTTLVEAGVRFARELRERGDRTEARTADRAFRDDLYDDG